MSVCLLRVGIHCIKRRRTYGFPAFKQQNAISQNNQGCNQPCYHRVAEVLCVLQVCAVAALDGAPQ